MLRGSSLLLNQFDALPLRLQEELLHYLDEQIDTHVGTRNQVPARKRIMATTNQHINRVNGEDMILSDLYFSFVIIYVPALRERDTDSNDILLLANFFLRKFARRYRKRVTGFSKDAKRAMVSSDWPDNIRQLRHRVLRGVIMAERSIISPEDLDLEGRTTEPTVGIQEVRELSEKELIPKVIARCEGNLTMAAKQLGISRPTLYALMDKLGLQRSS
jgi:two-component system, NtrC family, response regulator